MTKKLEITDIIIKIDSREKKPLRFPLHLRTEVACLKTGDYSALGLETIVAVERKSLQDLVNCIGRDRERFEKNITKLLALPVRAVVVEGCWIELEQQRYRGTVSPNSCIGSVISWIVRGVPFLFCGDPTRTSTLTQKILLQAATNAARGKYEGCEEFIESLKVRREEDVGVKNF